MGKREFNRRAFFLAALAVCVVSAGPRHSQAFQCDTGRVTITGAFGKAAFGVDLADTDESRAQGLMHVESMPMSRGMLFIYDQPQRLSFWMRNTLIELDMLFVDAEGVIRHIHHRAQPLDETVISPPGGALLRGVLEINGGLAARLGIEQGDVLHHQAFAGDVSTDRCGGSE